ncbi:dol-P-Man:Man(5)GlcNAc(2)-PP-Dol alpha-1,3-mannosyltransferase [Phalaenopsis equestris]|uniref:dol-P-Man:Man(5)GlcNAc(2)-PP-Dol alpha-1,3-mannosyltransferase n=1 Tax=Phalaenopsis equestris TaxID=78828 RepID=UPI0009E51FE0|nr:dol-P-Man:Man(5)GlcNAc(2)-PP-Dol alpha-1,3-mannosyltransferase [Phalaenopsis equestris]
MARGLSLGTKSSAEHSKSYGISKSAALIFALLFTEAILVALIIYFVPYTKIDWDAYMSQVAGFLGGERDYGNLKGDTGPLVYPAGFLYVYSAIKFFTGGQVLPAQILFGILYIANLGIVFLIYSSTDVLPWWAFVLLCLSKRIHSIFMLRLFNDCVAMTVLHAALVLLLYQKWHFSLIIFSAAVSVKMNVLLFAPPLLLLMLKALSIKGILSALSCAAFVQVALGLPFLLTYPTAYISRAFNLGRVFIHFWSVNFKFVPDEIFISKEFAIALLVIHLTVLLLFAHHKWCKYEGGLLILLRSRLHNAITELLHIRQFFHCESITHVLHKEHILTVLFVGNFIGIICARSLHYQFYSWYFFSLPFLLWKTPFPTIIRLLLYAGVEFCWNVYPSTSFSSLMLLFLHLTILWGLWISPIEQPFIDQELH